MNQETGNLFIERTKYKNMLPSAQQMGMPQPPLETEKPSGIKSQTLSKPDSNSLKMFGLLQAINERESIREYTKDPLTLDELGILLWCTQGVKTIIPGHVTFRTVPSAGARHALDTYLMINRVSGIQAGLYRYHALDHTIVQLSSTVELTNSVVKATLGQDMVRSSAVCFIWVAVTERMKWRYGERGYRYLFLDAGHVCQNLYLSCQMINSGACAIAAFDDNEMNKIIGVDGTEEFVVYMASVGKR